MEAGNKVKKKKTRKKEYSDTFACPVHKTLLFLYAAGVDIPPPGTEKPIVAWQTWMCPISGCGRYLNDPEKHGPSYAEKRK